MSSLSTVLQQLQQERTQAQQQVEKLNSAISVIEGLVGRNGSGATKNGARTGHTVSAASRRKMALAQKARWARVRQEAQPAAAEKTSAAPVKRTMSVAARRKIAAFQRARWAKLKRAA
jgi:hypothetical protein